MRFHARIVRIPVTVFQTCCATFTLELRKDYYIILKQLNCFSVLMMGHGVRQPQTDRPVVARVDRQVVGWFRVFCIRTFLGVFLPPTFVAI